MPGPTIAGTFATGQVANNVGMQSDVFDTPTGVTSAKLTTVGLDGSNTVKTQKSTNNGASWTDQVTYNSDQTNTAVTVAAGEQWRIVGVTQQATKDVRFKFTCEA